MVRAGSAGTVGAMTLAILKTELDARNVKLAILNELDPAIAGKLRNKLTDAKIDAITEARLAELDAANLPTDTTTLLSRLSAARATNLDNLDATISSRNSVTPATVAAIATKVWDELISTGRVAASIGQRLKDAVGLDTLSAAKVGAITEARLAELDAANLPTDTTTLLTRLSAARAANLDNLDALISSRNATTPPTVAAIATKVWDELISTGRVAASMGQRMKDAIGLDTLSAAKVAFVDASIAAIPTSNPTAAAVATAVWDELISTGRVAASMGQRLKDAIGLDTLSAAKVAFVDAAISAIPTSNPTTAAIATKVWDELISTGRVAASMGQRLKDAIGLDTLSAAKVGAITEARLANLDATISSRNATTPPTAAAVATLVWDELISTGRVASSMGQRLKDAVGLDTLSAAKVAFVDAAISAITSKQTQLAEDSAKFDLTATTLAIQPASGEFDLVAWSGVQASSNVRLHLTDGTTDSIDWDTLGDSMMKGSVMSTNIIHVEFESGSGTRTFMRAIKTMSEEA